MKEMRTVSSIRKRLWGNLKTIAAGTAALLLTLSWTSASAYASPEAARQADSFVNSIGVNVHLHYNDTVYGDFNLVKTRLLDLGVKHVRDGAIDTTWTDYYDRHNELGRAGIKGDFVFGPGSSASFISSFPSRVSDSFESYEGPNELDLSGDPNYGATLHSFMPVLWGNKSPGYPVIGPSATSIEAYQTIGDLSGNLDYGNMHDYLGGRNPGTGPWGDNGYGTIDYNINAAKIMSGTKPMYATETGYATGNCSGCVPMTVQGKYMPRLLLEQFNHGVERTYLYELMDQGTDGGYETSLGLVQNNGTPKPSYNAIRNLIGLLNDPGPSFNTGSLDYSLNGATGDVHHTLLQKRDGSYYLLLWREVSNYDVNTKQTYAAPGQQVTLQLAGGASMTPYTLDDNGNMTQGSTVSGSSIGVMVTDRVTAIKLVPGSSGSSDNGIVSGATYKLMNPNSGKYLDVAGAGTDNGTNVQIWQDTGSVAQQWTIMAKGDGTYKLINPGSGKALDVSGSGTANGSNVQIWEDNNGLAQTWQIIGKGDGTYKLINPNSGKALDVSASGTNNGTNVQIWEDNNGLAQTWLLNKL